MRLRLTEENRAWWTLAGACGGLFLLMLDSTVVTLALPDIERDVGASAAEVQWVVNAYLLVMAALVVTTGRLGDIFGRRRVYLIGLATFGVGFGGRGDRRDARGPDRRTGDPGRRRRAGDRALAGDRHRRLQP